MVTAHAALYAGAYPLSVAIFGEKLQGLLRLAYGRALVCLFVLSDTKLRSEINLTRR